MTIKDFIVNLWLRIRFFFIRNFRKDLIVNFSGAIKSNLNLNFYDHFTIETWLNNPDKKWDVGEEWGLVNPHRRNVYMSNPTLRIYEKDGSRNYYGVFFARHNPKKFMIQGEEYTVPFEVSWLSNHNFHVQKYGRWECRITMPEGKATWPAFWTWGELTWPPEIDILEAYGRNRGVIRKQYIQLHWGADGFERKTIGKAWGVRLPKTKDGFHEFVMEWKPDSITMYTDGVKVFQYTNKKVLKKWFDHQPHRTLINHNLRNDGVDGTKYLKPEEYEDYYSEFLVDYVRIYQFKKEK